MSRFLHIPLHVQAAVFAQVDGTAYAQALADSMAVENPIRDTSGDQPKYIMPEHVLYSYPADRQYNFYSKEHGDAYLLVEYDYSYLFTTEKPAGYDQKVRLKNFSGTTQAAPFRYTTSPVTTDNNVQFELSVSLKDFTFKADEIYSMSVVNIPKTTVSKLDANIVAQTHKVDSTTSDVDVTTHSAEGDLEILEQTEIYSAHFRTSSYSTFAEKMGKMTVDEIAPWQENNSATTFNLISNVVDNSATTEFFDSYEYNYGDWETNLVSFMPDYSATPYYTNKVAPLIYENADLESMIGVNYNPPTNGKVVALALNGNSLRITDTDIETGRHNAYISNSNAYNNHMQKYIDKDYLEICTKLANALVKTSDRPKGVSSFLKTNNIPELERGDYPIKAIYKLPGKTRTKTLTINVKY